MADVLDPATMDALNQLGDEIEAQGDAGASPEAVPPVEQPAEAPADEAAPEPAEGQETAAENAEGEQGEGDADGEPPAKPKRVQKDKDVQRLLRERYEARNKAEAAEAKAAEFQRRIAELEAAQRPADPAAPPATGTAPAPPVIQRQGEAGRDFEQRVQAEAVRRAKAASFDDACNKVATKGIETYKDFSDAQGALMGAFGRQVNMRPEFLQAIIRLENGHDVFHHLGTNLEAAEALFAHAEPVDLVMAMGELSAKLKTPKTPPKLSSAPAPVTPIRGGSNSNRAAVRLDDDKAPMDDWSKQFLKDMAS